MAGRGAGLRGQIDRLWDLGTFVGLTDAQLLARFAAGHGNGAELASRPSWNGTGRWSSASAGACSATSMPLRTPLPRAGQEGTVALGQGLARKLAARRRASRRGPGGPTPPVAAGTSVDSRRPGARRARPCRIIPGPRPGRSSPRRSPGSRVVPGGGRPLLP